MRPMMSTPPEHPEAPTTSPACSSACPVCGGALVPTRQARRCVRCNFSLCEDCEGGDTTEAYES